MSINDTPTRRTRMLLLAAAVGTTALLLTGCTATDAGPAPSASQTASSEAADFNMADEMFTVMMIPHHEQAIEMSDVLLAKEDVDPAVADLAPLGDVAPAPTDGAPRAAADRSVVLTDDPTAAAAVGT